MANHALPDYRIDKAAEVTTQSFGRRSRQWTPEDDAMNRQVMDAARQVEAVTP